MTVSPTARLEFDFQTAFEAVLAADPWVEPPITPEARECATKQLLLGLCLSLCFHGAGCVVFLCFRED